jgi:hypothetical protein
LKVTVYTEASMARPKQRDLFGAVRETPRGWTELDRVRRRYAVLERKVSTGDFTSAEMEEFGTLRAQIALRETEAREKWAKSFGS